MICRLVLVDDHALVRTGLRQIFAQESDIEVVGEAGDSVELMSLLRSTTCDVLLLDISLPGRSGLDALKLVRERWPDIRVLMLSMYPEDQYAVRAVRAGAWGYLHKNIPPSTMLQAIRTVHAGRRYITPELADQLAQHVIRGDEDKLPHEKLSDREFQTLVAIASGQTLGQIGEQMGVSPKTVSVYRARLLEKTGLANNSEVTHYAMKHGLVN